MMAGARVAMMTSALLKNGIDHLRTVLTGLTDWMSEHEYSSIREMQGRMSQWAVAEPAAFERGNYMRTLSSYRERT
jgi:dihydroorotate dehydrogenase (fumarate)